MFRKCVAGISMRSKDRGYRKQSFSVIKAESEFGSPSDLHCDNHGLGRSSYPQKHFPQLYLKGMGGGHSLEFWRAMNQEDLLCKARHSWNDVVCSVCLRWRLSRFASCPNRKEKQIQLVATACQLFARITRETRIRPITPESEKDKREIPFTDCHFHKGNRKWWLLVCCLLMCALDK